jgi:hypothetical protein
MHTLLISIYRECIKPKVDNAPNSCKDKNKEESANLPGSAAGPVIICPLFAANI